MLRRIRSALKLQQKNIHFLRYMFVSLSLLSSVRYGVTANITAFHAVARGSIPRTGICTQHCVIFFICLCYTKALQILTPIGCFVFYSRLRCLKMFLYHTGKFLSFFSSTSVPLFWIIRNTRAFVDWKLWPSFSCITCIGVCVRRSYGTLSESFTLHSGLHGLEGLFKYWVPCRRGYIILQFKMGSIAENDIRYTPFDQE